MYLRIDGPHEEALVRLAELYGEKTTVAVARQLIRNAALQAKVWPATTVVDDDADAKPAVERNGAINGLPL